MSKQSYLSVTRPEVDATAAKLPSSERQSLPRRQYKQKRLRVLAFGLADQTYVVDLALIEEIIRSTTLVTVEIASKYVEGLIKRRGRIVPVVDLRKKLGLSARAATVETSVIIAKLPFGLVGFIVDSVFESLWVETSDFEIPSPVVIPIDQAYIQGIAHLGDKVLIMLDLEPLFMPEEQEVLQGLRGQVIEASPGTLVPTQTLFAEHDAAATQSPAEAEQVGARRRLVMFELSGELYGIPIEQVTEISRPLTLMPLPHTPAYVLGLVNLRGTILPVIDLRHRFGLSINPPGFENRLLFLKSSGGQVALWVEAVHDLARLPESDFKPAPSGVARIAAEYYSQVALLGERLLIELDIEKLLVDTTLEAGRSEKL